jgi:hypothetical protein
MATLDIASHQLAGELGVVRVLAEREAASPPLVGLPGEKDRVGIGAADLR